MTAGCDVTTCDVTQVLDKALSKLMTMKVSQLAHAISVPHFAQQQDPHTLSQYRESHPDTLIPLQAHGEIKRFSSAALGI